MNLNWWIPGSHAFCAWSYVYRRNLPWSNVMSCIAEKKLNVSSFNCLAYTLLALLRFLNDTGKDIRVKLFVIHRHVLCSEKIKFQVVMSVFVSVMNWVLNSRLKHRTWSWIQRCDVLLADPEKSGTVFYGHPQWRNSFPRRRQKTFWLISGRSLELWLILPAWHYKPHHQINKQFFLRVLK